MTVCRCREASSRCMTSRQRPFNLHAISTHWVQMHDFAVIYNPFICSVIFITAFISGGGGGFIKGKRATSLVHRIGCLFVNFTWTREAYSDDLSLPVTHSDTDTKDKSSVQGLQLQVLFSYDIQWLPVNPAAGPVPRALAEKKTHSLLTPPVLCVPVLPQPASSVAPYSLIDLPSYINLRKPQWPRPYFPRRLSPLPYFFPSWLKWAHPWSRTSPLTAGN